MGWTIKEQPPPVLLPGKPHGQRSLVGYSPRGCKELDTTEHKHTHARTHTHTHTHTHTQTHTHSLWRMGNLSGGQTSNLETHCGDPSQRVLGKIIEPTLNSVSFLQSLSNDFHLPNSMGKSISREPYI